MKDKLEQTLGIETAEEAPEESGLRSIAGVGPKTAQALAEAGYKTTADLKAASEEELLAVKGIGKKTVEKILVALGKTDVSPETEETGPVVEDEEKKG